MADTAPPPEDQPNLESAVGADQQPVAGSEVAHAEQTGRRGWFRSTWFLAFVGVAVAMGLYVVGLVALVLVATDQTRDRHERSAIMATLAWWVAACAGFGIQSWWPYVSSALLLVAATLWLRAARARREDAVPAGRGRRLAPLVMAGITAVAAVAGLVPWGYRNAELTETDALQRAVSERRASRGAVTQGFVETARTRFVHRPFFGVVLYGGAGDSERTQDGEPCFRRAEVHRVDGLSGEVTFLYEVEGKADAGHCVPIRAGTRRELRPVNSGPGAG